MGLDQDTAVTEDIAGSIRQVQLSIAAAAEQADRPPESVTLVAVSKGQPTARIRKAYAAGLREFGENRVVGLPSLQIQGLMTMAPLTPDEGLIRSVFHRLRVLQEYLEQRLPGHWSELSMGMSDDYRLAIAEGATIVRIGRAIFGPGEVEG